MELARAAEMHVLGILQVEDLPEMALKTLENGYDSPSLRQLAGSHDANSENIMRLFYRTLDELNVKILSPTEAGLSMARRIASEVIKGIIEPYNGAKRIWNDIYTRLPELIELRGFVGFASEYEDDLQHRDEYSRLIIEECKAILECK